MFRDLTIHDLKTLEPFALFPMPNVNSPLYFYQKALIDEDGNLIGAAFAKITSEVSLIFDPNAKSHVKMKTLLNAWDDIELAHAAKGLEDTHVFLLGDCDGNFEAILQKLGFVQATGTPLYYRIWSKICRKVNSKKRTNKQLASSSSPQPKSNRGSMVVEPLVQAD